jgi:hypothetical protein
MLLFLLLYQFALHRIVLMRAALLLAERHGIHLNLLIGAIGANSTLRNDAAHPFGIAHAIIAMQYEPITRFHLNIFK